MKPLFFFLLLFAVIGLIFPSNALACACCADEGMHFTWTGKPSEYDVGLLGEMKFAKAANIYFTEGDAEVRGLESIEKDMESDVWLAADDHFDLTSSFLAKTWKFTFKTPNGKTGVLTLPLPLQMVQYKVDIHDEENRPNGPLLYKEWRFKGTVSSGTGFLKAGIIRPTKYFLVLQGRGNGCDNTEDFTHWRLEITGKKAEYAILGKLSSGADYNADESEN